MQGRQDFTPSRYCKRRECIATESKKSSENCEPSGPLATLRPVTLAQRFCKTCSARFPMTVLSLSSSYVNWCPKYSSLTSFAEIPPYPTFRLRSLFPSSTRRSRGSPSIEITPSHVPLSTNFTTCAFRITLSSPSIRRTGNRDTLSS